MSSSVTPAAAAALANAYSPSSDPNKHFGRHRGGRYSRTGSTHSSTKSRGRRSSLSTGDAEDIARKFTTRRIDGFDFSDEGTYQNPTLLRSVFCDVIHYYEPWKLRWNMFIALLALYSFVATPLDVAFLTENRTYEYAIDAIFLVDVYLHFRTTYASSRTKEEVRVLSRITASYFYTWFAIDLISSLPLHAFIPPSKESAGIIVLRFNKALRLFRIRSVLNNFIESSWKRVLRLVAFFIMCAHWVGCIFFLIGRTQDHGTPGGRWIDAFHVRYMSFEMQYVTSVYWALTTLSTVGYGDITAISWAEKLFSACVMILGSVLYATIFGILATTIQNFDKTKVVFQDKMHSVREFCKWNDLPSFVQDRLCEYVEHDWVMNQRGSGGEFALTAVPPLVRCEIMMFMYSDLIKKVPMFANCNRRFLEAVVTKFKPQVFLWGDYLIREGDIGKELFFVLRGTCDILKFPSEQAVERDFAEIEPDELRELSIQVAERKPGSFVGEAALLSGARRGASVVAATDAVQALYLLREDFLECIDSFPELASMFAGISELRKAESENAASSAKSEGKNGKKNRRLSITENLRSMRRKSAYALPDDDITSPSAGERTLTKKMKRKGTIAQVVTFARNLSGKGKNKDAKQRSMKKKNSNSGRLTKGKSIIFQRSKSPHSGEAGDEAGDSQRRVSSVTEEHTGGLNDDAADDGGAQVAELHPDIQYVEVTETTP